MVEPGAGAASFVRSPLLQQCTPVRHAFSTRHGGASQGSYQSLNLAAHLTDDAAAVQENRRRLLAQLGRPLSSWTQASQVHGNDVLAVSSHAPITVPADALVTQDPAVTLAILVADCVPIVLADPGGRVVASIHAGWRGTASNIVGRAVEACCRVANVRAETLRAALGPAIGPCCFRVGEEVAHALAGNAPSAQLVSNAIFVRNEAWYPDLWLLNETHLRRAGLATDHIESLRICTFCTPDFFSYRRDGKLTGRHAGLVGLVGHSAA